MCTFAAVFSRYQRIHKQTLKRKENNMENDRINEEDTATQDVKREVPAGTAGTS